MPSSHWSSEGYIPSWPSSSLGWVPTNISPGCSLSARIGIGRNSGHLGCSSSVSYCYPQLPIKGLSPSLGGTLRNTGVPTTAPLMRVFLHNHMGATRGRRWLIEAFRFLSLTIGTLLWLTLIPGRLGVTLTGFLTSRI
jgi:hypothetical protein